MSVNKRELDFSLILFNAICVNVIENLANVLIFRSIKNTEEGKKGRESNNGLKRSLPNHWLTMRLNLSSDNVRNCAEITMFVKECGKIIKCKKKGTINLADKQGLLFEK